MGRREPDRTREALVEAAFWEIFRNGYQGASLEAILAKAGVTKGALYHHFRSKKELGYAVVDETIHGWFKRLWIDPLAAADDPVEGLKAVLRTVEREAPEEVWELGCPLNNLAQEMSPLDEGFRTRIRSIFRSWQEATEGAIRRGIEGGVLRKEVDPAAVTTLLIAAFEGAAGLAKNARDPGLFQATCRQLVAYLEGLRPPSERAA